MSRIMIRVQDIPSPSSILHARTKNFVRISDGGRYQFGYNRSSDDISDLRGSIMNENEDCKYKNAIKYKQRLTASSPFLRSRAKRLRNSSGERNGIKIHFSIM